MEALIPGWFFKSKATEYDCALNPGDAEAYLKLTRKCMERTQNMTAESTSSSRISLHRIALSPIFNFEQCKYLADKLKSAVESGECFLELLNRGELQFHSRGDKANCLEVFKLLCSLADAVESFIQSCSKNLWIQTAMFWTNASEHVSFLSFNLQLCTLVFLASEELRAGQNVTPTEVDAVFKAEVKIIREMESRDRTTLVTKLNEYLGKEKKTERVYHLADLLLQRLQRSRDAPTGSSQLSKLYGTLGGGLKKNLKLFHMLGKGSFGTVYKAKWLGVDVAKKTFDEYVPCFDEEVYILARLSHPNIASLLCYAKDKKECSIVTELMDGDLSSLIESRKTKRHSPFPFDLFEAVDIMHQIGEGIRYLHGMKIVHRDLKSGNILVRCLKGKEMEIEYVLVKVADFGLSKIKENTATFSPQTMKQGTLRWMAPEMMKASEGDILNYPLKVDVYSFAMVCTEILTGELPYSKSVNTGHVYKTVLAGERPQLPNSCPPLLKNLIERCWNQDASQRPSFDVICADLRHIKCLLLMPCNIMVIGRPGKEPTDQSRRSTDGSGSILGCRSNAYQEATSNVIQLSKKEKPQPQRLDWVISLDFGTTYSGFAFATRLVDDPEIRVCYDWPSLGNEKPYCKTLTALYYKPNEVECPSWGHIARSEYTSLDHRRSSQHGGRGHYFTKFKLWLNKGYQLDDCETSAISWPHSANTIITDYLKHIGEHALKLVEEYIANHTVFSKLNLMFSKDSVQWCVTVPSIWDDNAKQQMKTCMVNAGLVSAEAGGIDAVKVVLEPEAASFHCHQKLREDRKDVPLQAKDKILVADVGGGTVDIVVQELIASGDEYKVKELTESSGGLCGGSFVDDSFMRFLSKKIGCLDEFLRKNEPSYKADLLKAWEQIKCAFGHEMMSSTDTMDIHLHYKLAPQWEAYEMKRGNSLDDSSVVELTEQDLKSIFDPVVDEILELIAAQLTQVWDIKVMFVVGGFASSPYLIHRIRTRFSRQVTRIISPPNPGSAIIEGAVSLALHPDAIVSRVAKKTYGTDVILRFDENLDPPKLLVVTEGKKYCKNRFDVFVKKGTQVDVNKGVMKEYCPHSNGQTQLRFDLYSSTEEDPRYTEGPTATKEGEFSVTIPPEYRRMDSMFKFTMYFGRSSIELRAVTHSKNGREQLVERLEMPIEYFH